MILEPLTACIEQAKERINQHGPLLRGSEALTRYVLIDPLLRALGWDTSDPELVRPEYRDTGGIADYALMSGDRPAALLEAKKFGENLSQAIDQALYYCFRQRITYMVVSDGNQWELHDAFKRDDVDTSVIKVSLQHDTTQAAALKLLHFWQPNLGASSGLTAPPAPVAVPIAPPTPAYALPEPAPAAPIHMADASLPGNWTPLSRVLQASGTDNLRAIRFPNGESRQIKSWANALVQLTDWLAGNEYFDARHCPLPGLGFVNSQPVSARGITFRRYQLVSGGIYVNFNQNAGLITINMRKLLNHFRINPETVELSFE